MPKPNHSRQPRQPAFSLDSVTPIPTVEQIYQQRTAIDALSLEIENDQKLFAEQIAEKKKRLREFQAELSTSIRQTNAALQQLAVPVTSDATPDPLIESTPIKNNADALNTESINILPPTSTVPLIPAPIPSPVTPAPEPISPTALITPTPVTTGYSPLFIAVVICVLFFAMLTYCGHKPTPNPSPPPNPIVITTTDQIIKEVESQTLTHNEKIVEATRRLVQEANMEREAAYKYATEKIKNIPNDPSPSDNPPLSVTFPSPEETIRMFSSIILQGLEALPSIPTFHKFSSRSKKKQQQSLNPSTNLS